MTKEEILNKHVPHEGEYELRTWTENKVYSAMDQYAKQQAIAFVIHVLGKLKKDRSSWVAQENDDYIMAVQATIDNHYDKFFLQQPQSDEFDKDIVKRQALSFGAFLEHYASDENNWNMYWNSTGQQYTREMLYEIFISQQQTTNTDTKTQ